MQRDYSSDARVLSQFFTLPHIAEQVVHKTREFLEHQGHNWNTLKFLECAAGTGNLLNLLPSDRSVGVDVDAKLDPGHPNYQIADLSKDGFLGLSADEIFINGKPLSKFHRQEVVAISNPPWNEAREVGRSRIISVDFLNHCGNMCDTVAFIVGRSFRRPATQKRIRPDLQLVLDEDLPNESFYRDGKIAKLGCVFQIWQRQYGPDGRPAMRPELDEGITLSKGEWFLHGEPQPWKFVNSWDDQANVRILKWGSVNTVGKVDGPDVVIPQVKQNQSQMRQRQQQGLELKNYKPDTSYHYVCVNDQWMDPYEFVKAIEQRRHLFYQLASDRTTGNNPDISKQDIIRIYLASPETQYEKGQWIVPQMGPKIVPKTNSQVNAARLSNSSSLVSLASLSSMPSMSTVQSYSQFSPKNLKKKTSKLSALKSLQSLKTLQSLQSLHSFKNNPPLPYSQNSRNIMNSVYDHDWFQPGSESGFRTSPPTRKRINK